MHVLPGEPLSRDVQLLEGESGSFLADACCVLCCTLLHPFFMWRPERNHSCPHSCAEHCACMQQTGQCLRAAARVYPDSELASTVPGYSTPYQ